MEINEAVNQFAEYVNSHTPVSIFFWPFKGYPEDRERYVSEIMYQAFKELSNYQGENRLQHLKETFGNLCKRAKSECRKSNYSDGCGLEIDCPNHTNDCFNHTFASDVVRRLDKILTKRQRLVFSYLVSHQDTPQSEIYTALGYKDDSGYYRIVKRIRAKVEKIMSQ